MLQVHLHTRFRRDIKKAHQRGKNTDKLNKIVTELQNQHPLNPKHRAHKLIGDWNGCWECHIEPDWLLIYAYTDDGLWLMRTGTHSDLFD